MAPFPPESWPPTLDATQLSHLTTLATTYALAHSLQYLPPHSPASPPPPSPAAAIHAPIALFPAPIPRSVFADANRIQRAYSTLYARVAMDWAFLDGVMGALVDVDSFTGALWRAWREVREDSVQPLQLGLFRSDYLLHQPSAEDAVQYKQVEFNTISSSFGALSQQVAGLHRHLLASTGYFGASPLLKQENLPPNDTVAGLVSGMVAAHKAYGVPDAYILFVVQPDERNIFDQRLLEYELLEKHDIRVIRQTLAQLQSSATLSPTRTLLISSPTLPTPSSRAEISLVYFRAGYTPTDYASPSAYALRGLLERSKAIQCPSLALQLAGGKKVQEVLARPGVLERFLGEGEGAGELRGTWVGMWSLDASTSSIPPPVVHGVSLSSPPSSSADNDVEPAGTVLARERALDLVLKPQREGGGNNIYRASIPSFLASLPPSERSAWIAMELIRPPRAVGSYLMRSGDERALRADVISELGVFSWALFGFDEGKGKEVKTETAGWLVRTKAEGVDEGGVAAGFSVLDSVLLVD